MELNRQPEAIENLYSFKFGALWRYVSSQPKGFVAACCYLFFEYVRPQTIYPVVDFFPWAASFSMLALILSFIGPGKRFDLNAKDKWLIAFSFVVFLSSLFALDPGRSFDEAGLYFSWVVIYFAIVRNIRSKGQIFIFILLYLLCNFKMSQHGFLSFALRGFSFRDWGVTGAPGWFENSGEFGIQLCIFVPLAVAFLFALRRYLGKYVFLFLSLMPVTGIISTVATSSRGAFLGMVAAALWALRKTRRFFLTFSAIAALILLAWSLTPEESRNRFETAGEDNNSRHRIERWQAGWETIKVYPLLGVGYKNWEKYYDSHFVSQFEGTAMVHNVFVEVGTEHGILGLGVILMLQLSMFRGNKKTRDMLSSDEDRFLPAISNGLDAGTIGFIVSASFVTVLYYPYIWIHAAMCSSLYNVAMMESGKK